MGFKVFNTLGRKLEPFEPLEGRRVRMYTCGPTVYDHAHIGNFRAYIFEDLLRRHLKYSGYEVVQVMNLTDVDDKTIRGAREKGLSLEAFTRPFVEAFFADRDTLGIEPAEHYPAATDHIPEMIALVQTLLEKEYAYVSPDGSVYFSIARFKDYGKLARLDLSGMRAGARVAQDEYEKENAGDFALWKAWDEADGDVAWDAPWGRGRPGWHLECSAMSVKYLGPSFDLHTGGMDNIFPHHEDEIAQSEAAHGKPLARYWLHCAHLVVEGRKMSKSLGNFFTLRDVLAKGYSGREIRAVLLSTHYRQSLNFSFDALEAARAMLRRLDDFRARLADRAGETSGGGLPAWAENGQRAFREAMDDDLNVSGAFGALFDLVHEGHRALDGNQLDASGAAAVQTILDGFDGVLGCLAPEEEAAPPEVLELVNERAAARARKDWAEADRLRDLLAGQGWLVEDTPAGPKLKKVLHA